MLLIVRCVLTPLLNQHIQVVGERESPPQHTLEVESAAGLEAAGGLGYNVDAQGRDLSHSVERVMQLAFTSVSARFPHVDLPIELWRRCRLATQQSIFRQQQLLDGLHFRVCTKVCTFC